MDERSGKSRDIKEAGLDDTDWVRKGEKWEREPDMGMINRPSEPEIRNRNIPDWRKCLVRFPSRILSPFLSWNFHSRRTSQHTARWSWLKCSSVFKVCLCARVYVFIDVRSETTSREQAWACQSLPTLALNSTGTIDTTFGFDAYVITFHFFFFSPQRCMCSGSMVA